MNDAQLKVLLDALESAGQPVKEADLADVIAWARAPDAVRELLGHRPLRGLEGEYCAGCDSDMFTPEEPHDATCPVFAAWRALGDPRAIDDVERAHEQAIYVDRMDEPTRRSILQRANRRASVEREIRARRAARERPAGR